MIARPLWADFGWLGGAVAAGAGVGAAWAGPAQPVLAAGLAGAAVLGLAGLAWNWAARRRNRLAETLLRAAANADRDGRLIADGEGRQHFVNPAWGRLFGGKPGESPLTAVTSVLQGDAARAEVERLQRAARSGAPDHAEVTVRDPAGGIAWRHLAAHPLSGGNGLTLWTARDVTARREMEAARHRQERVLEDLLDLMPVGFFSADGEGRFLYVNRVLADWLGIPPGEAARGLMLADYVVHEEFADDDGEPRLSHEIDEDHPDAGLHGEVVLRGADGQPFHAYLRQSTREEADGAILYTRSVVLRAMAGSGAGTGWRGWEHRYRSLFADAPVGIVLVELDGEVRDCNRAFLKLIGLHREAVVGHPLVERLAKEDRSDANAQLSKVVMGTIPAAHLDIRLPSARHGEVAASLFASRMEEGPGEIGGLIVHFIDTTQRKQLEMQFSQSQKIQAMGQLAGGVAHDFNNLLTAMIGFCDLLLSRHGAGDPSFHDIMQIKQNANRAANLVRQLLAFSRRQTLQPKVLDVTDALSELANLLRRLIGEKIELDFQHGRDLGLIRVDPGQFDQVIINLAVNARDAMPGGGRLTIATTNVTTEQPIQRGAELMPPGDYVRIEVADTGTGIAKENLGRIFEPFFSTKEVGRGTGLGLSTVYGILRQTEGYIFVDSALGEGTTFTIHLPRLERGAAVVEAPAEAAKIEGGDLTGQGTVLLVEDEDAVRSFAARALRNKGYHVLEAESGEAGLDVLKGLERSVDLIVSDVVMPGMDGLTFVRLVREELPEVKVVLVSGYTDDMLPREIGDDPTLHFLHKPFSLKDLAGKVKEVLGG